MSAPSQLVDSEIVVVGAGVLGLATAAELTLRGHRVTVVDPGGPNASSVAAGMIGPGFESVLDGATPERARLLRDAAALWPDFAERHGLRLDARPAVWRGPNASLFDQRLRHLGFPSRLEGDEVSTADRRIDVAPAMARLSERVTLRAGRAVSAHVEQGGWILLLGGGELRARQVILASGAAPAIAGPPLPAARLIEAIEPIRGQIGWIAEPLVDRVVRGQGAYLAPSEGGTLIGATMEAGRRDLEPDPATCAALVHAAEVLLGRRLREPVEWRVGVRGATPDGLPMAGAMGTDGLFAALAPRRNGWLLAPLVAHTVADAVEERPRGAYADALDPLRFLTAPAG